MRGDIQKENIENQEQNVEAQELAEEVIDLPTALANFRISMAEDIDKIAISKPKSILEFIYSQKNYLDGTWMEQQLEKLHQLLTTHKAAIIDAFVSDYDQNAYEAEIMEYAPVMHEIEDILKNFKKWRANEIDTTFPNCFWKSTVQHKPRGIVLIMSSQKTMLSSILIPLANSIAAGNYTVLNPKVPKTVATTPEIFKVIINIVKQLDKNRVLLTNEHEFELDSFLRENHIDMIFSTRSYKDNIINYEIAAKHNVEFKAHTVGWNVALLDKFSNYDKAAKLIAQNKFYKSGQDVNSLDYVLCHQSITRPFITMLKDHIHTFYSHKGQDGQEYGKMVNSQHFKRIMNLAEKTEHGGIFETSLYSDERSLQINPIIIRNPRRNSPMLADKTMGPILPIIEYNHVDEARELLNSKDNLENLYYFSQNTRIMDDITTQFKFKNLYFNDSTSPLNNQYVPKSGVFSIGNNELRGVYGIQTFSKQTLHQTGLNSIRNSEYYQRLNQYWFMQKLTRKRYLAYMLISTSLYVYNFLF